jgi:hypothetical protein
MNSYYDSLPRFTSLTQVTKAYRSGQLMETEEFFFKGFPCHWADYDTRDGVVECSFDRLRCDPSTDAEYKDFYRLSRLDVFCRNWRVDVVLS